MVRLEPITEDNLAEVFELRVKPEQEQHVASVAWSLAQAVADWQIAWLRAVVADDQVVGFLMLEIDPDDEDGRPFWLWRLMIDERFQRRGFGGAALWLAVEEVRRRDGTELYTSWVPGADGPESFYLGHGFVPTGELDDGEIVAALHFVEPDA